MVTIGKRVGLVARWGLVLGVAVGLVALPCTGLAARPTTMVFPPGSPRPAPDVALEVKVAPAIAEAADLQRWVSEEGRRVLDGLPQEPRRRGSLRVEIGGALYEYRVVITAVRDGAVVGTPREWACECSNEELLERVRGEVATTAEHLSAKVEEPAVAKPTSEVKPTPDVVVDGPPRRRLGPAGAAGVTAMVLGATGVGAGVALMVVGDRDEPAPIGQVGERRLFVPGQVIVAAGGGLLLTGMVLYFLRKRIDRSGRKTASMVAPAFEGRGEVRLSVVGRF